MTNAPRGKATTPTRRSGSCRYRIGSLQSTITVVATIRVPVQQFFRLSIIFIVPRQKRRGALIENFQINFANVLVDLVPQRLHVAVQLFASTIFLVHVLFIVRKRRVVRGLFHSGHFQHGGPIQQAHHLGVSGPQRSNAGVNGHFVVFESLVAVSHGEMNIGQIGQDGAQFQIVAVHVVGHDFQGVFKGLESRHVLLFEVKDGSNVAQGFAYRQVIGSQNFSFDLQRFDVGRHGFVRRGLSTPLPQVGHVVNGGGHRRQHSCHFIFLFGCNHRLVVHG
mmetsp:Transcript_2696/g.6855  ORF Transcript_2696/g.6855 Transcript_2696/m.6855 type:complete len:278 (+) Transcript_2696:293-1126(+)